MTILFPIMFSPQNCACPNFWGEAQVPFTRNCVGLAPLPLFSIKRRAFGAWASYPTAADWAGPYAPLFARQGSWLPP